MNDKRFEISQDTGHNGWIDLAVEEEQDWAEIGALALASYRHFALKWERFDPLPAPAYGFASQLVVVYNRRWSFLGVN